MLRSLALALLWLLAMPAHAACAVSSANVKLGDNVPSFALASGSQPQPVQETSTITPCGGTLVALLTSDSVTASVVNMGSSQLFLTSPNSPDSIPFFVCQDSTCATPIQPGSSVTWTSSTVLSILSSSSASIKIYVKALPANVKPGTYTGTVTINWTWSLCSIGIALCLANDSPSAPVPSTFTVSLTVAPDCMINTPQPLNFGSAAFVGSFTPATQTVSMHCSKGTSYTIGLDKGLNYAAGRRMANNGNYIAYQIYYPATSTTTWGNDDEDGPTVSSDNATGNAGIYDGTNDQTYTYKGQIVAGQATPPPGQYSDTIILTVTANP